MSPNIELADADRSGLLTLQADEVHIWLTRLDDVSDQFLTGRYLDLLPTAERERQERFIFPPRPQALPCDVHLSVLRFPGTWTCVQRTGASLKTGSPGRRSPRPTLPRLGSPSTYLIPATG